jgi:hypothetical protein
MTPRTKFVQLPGVFRIGSEPATILSGDRLGHQVKLKTFLVGSVLAAFGTVMVALTTDMAWYGVLGLGLSVWVVSQLAYVGLIALSTLDLKREDEPPSDDKPVMRVGQPTKQLNDDHL